MSDYNQHYCPKCGARLGHVEGDVPQGVIRYRPCGCEVPMFALVRMEYEDVVRMEYEDVVRMEYEDALGEGKEWALESHQFRYWASLDGKRVVIEDPESMHPYEGIWQWHGPTGDDFWLVYILDDKGELIVGTDPRNFTSVRLAGGIGGISNE